MFWEFIFYYKLSLERHAHESTGMQLVIECIESLSRVDSGASPLESFEVARIDSAVLCGLLFLWLSF